MTDERKVIFIETVENLFNAYPLNVPTEALEFFEDYKKCKTSTAKEMTEKGWTILSKMQEINDWITAKSLGEALDISGRSVSGTMRKLVSDGFVEKKTGTPASYKITEKGMDYQYTTESEA